MHPRAVVTPPRAPKDKPSGRAALAVVLSTALLGSSVRADILSGRHLPTFTATDLSGTDHSSHELRRGPLLVVLITTRAAADGLRGWNQAFDARYGPRMARYSLVSIDIPFFVAHATVRSQARGETPQGFWAHTWISMHDEFEEAFGVEESPLPWAIAMGPDGRVSAVLHAQATSPEAGSIWRSLDALSAPPRPLAQPAAP